MKESSTRLTDPLSVLPAEYWETGSPVYGALADNVSVDGLLFFSSKDIPVGTKLNLRIFYANEYELDDIKAISKIVRKNAHIAEDWKGYEYTLKFIQMSEEDLRKLTNLLNGYLELERISGKDIALENPSLTKTRSSPPFVGLDLPEESTAKCKFYRNAKCLKTNTFCNLCHNEDDIDLVQGRGTKGSWSSPFTSILAKLADNFRSVFQDH